MKFFRVLFWVLTSSGWAWCALAGGGYQHLMRPIYGEPTLQTLKVRGGFAAFPAFTGFIRSTNVTAFTAILWTKVASYPAGHIDGGVGIDASFSVESARATTEGGPGLEDLLHDAYMVNPIPLSAGGTWQANCLPNGYDCPDSLADKWGYGCYCFNLTTDTPLTLTVGGAELYIPATNSMIRNIQAVSADRTVTIAAERAGASVNFGIAENPLIQFVSAGSSNNTTSYSFDDISMGGPTSTEWRMVVVRGRIQDGNGFGQTDSYNETTHFPNVSTETTELAHPRAVFAFDSRVRMVLSNLFGGLRSESTGEEVRVKFYGGKLLKGWLTDGDIEKIRDIDAAELRRRGEIR